MLIFTINRKAYHVVSIFFNSLTRELLEDYRFKFQNIVPSIPNSLLIFNHILKKAKFKISTRPYLYKENSEIMVSLGSVREDIDTLIISDLFDWLEQISLEQIEYLCSYINDARIDAPTVFEALKLFYFELTNIY